MDRAPELTVKKFLVAAALLLAGAGVHAEIRLHEQARPVAGTAIRPGSAAFSPSPIPAEWIVAGSPVTEVATVSETHDGSAQVYLWRTTASTFRWTHGADEIITILDGEVFITEADGKRHHLTPGDVAHFPVGSVQLWDVPGNLLKSAILKHRSPTLVEASMRWVRRVRALVTG
ncbi:cupin domain-containing protein [Methylobacterium sp. P5_C11]